MNNYREGKRCNFEVFLSDVLKALELPYPLNRQHNGPSLWEVPRHWWTTPMATKLLMALLAGSGNPATGSTFPAQCETEEVYSAPCKHITRGALSHNEKMRNFQDAKICLQLKPRRFKSRLQIPQTPSRQPMLTDEGKSIQFPDCTPGVCSCPGQVRYTSEHYKAEQLQQLSTLSPKLCFFRQLNYLSHH